MTQKPHRSLLILLVLILLLPLGVVRAEPYEFTEAPLYDETAEHGIADPKAAHELFEGLAPTLSLEELDETYGTLSVVATFTNETEYPMQGYSFSGTMRSNGEKLNGEFADYVLMPGDTQSLVLLSNLYVDEEEFVLDSAEDFVLEVMVGNFFDSSGHIASVRYDAVEDEVTDIQSYPSIPLVAEALINLDDIGIEFDDSGNGWIEYSVHNRTDRPIVYFEMFFQDTSQLGVKLSYYETILPGHSSPDLLLSYNGLPPDTNELEPMSVEVGFYLEGRETSVRYDYRPAMYRSTDPDLARNGVWEPGTEEEIEKPEITIPETFEFPVDPIAIENEIQDMPYAQAFMATLKPEFTIEEVTASSDEDGDAASDEGGERAFLVTYTNTTPYPIGAIDFSGRILSTNEAMRFHFEDYVLMPGETHAQLVWMVLAAGEPGMESEDDYELSQVQATLIDGTGHMTDLTYDLRLDRLKYAFGYPSYEWTRETLMDIDEFDYEIIDKGEDEYAFVIHNKSEHTITFAEWFIKTTDNHLLQLQSYEVLAPGDKTEENWLYVPVSDIDLSALEPVHVMVAINEADAEIPLVYDKSLDMYQDRSLPDTP